MDPLKSLNKLVTNESEFTDQGDVVVTVRLPKREYDILREIIQTQQALSGFKKFLQNTILWLAASAISVFALWELFKRY